MSVQDCPTIWSILISPVGEAVNRDLGLSTAEAPQPARADPHARSGFRVLFAPFLRGPGPAPGSLPGQELLIRNTGDTVRK